jgi:hypothetical protein
MPDVAHEFVAAARAFRAALLADDVEIGAFARQVRNALARVYLAAALLGPPRTPESDDVAAHAPREDAGRRALGERLKARFGEHDIFVDVYDPSRLVDEDVDPLQRSLSQELVEIDEDLAEALALFERNRVDALWDVQWAFENHWGQHALACLRPLHQLVTYGVV